MKELENKFYQKSNVATMCLLYILQAVVILIWTIYLCIHTDSLPSIYILCAVCSLCLLFSPDYRKTGGLLQSRFLFPFLAVLLRL